MSVLLFLLFIYLFIFIYLFFIFLYWDLELMPLSATKRCRPDFNRAYSSA